MAAHKRQPYNAVFRDERYHPSIVNAVTTRWIEGESSNDIAKATGFLEAHVANIIARFQDRRYAMLNGQFLASRA